MSKNTISYNLNEALNAYEAYDFVRAESLSRAILQKQQGCTEAHCCADFTKALYLAAKSHAKLEKKEEIGELISSLPRENACILSHNVPEDIGPFRGTAEDFTSMYRRQEKPSISPDASTGRNSTDSLTVLLFLCSLCLDFGLYSCALNLALQLHDIALDLGRQQQQNQKPNNFSSTGDSKWSDDDDDAAFDGIEELTTMDGDYLSLDLPPAGLTRELWVRVVECCSGLTPVVVTSQSDHNSNQYEEHFKRKSIDLGQSAEEKLMLVNGSNGLSIDLSDQAHFTRVHEFSVKEEHLRAHTHASHEARRNSKDHASHLIPISTQSDNRVTEVNKDDDGYVNSEIDREPNLLDFYSLDAAKCRRKNEDLFSELDAAIMGPWVKRFTQSDSNMNALTTDFGGAMPMGHEVLGEDHEPEADRSSGDVCSKLATELNGSAREIRRLWSDDADGDDGEGSVGEDVDSDKDDEPDDRTECDKSRIDPSTSQAHHVSILRSPSVNVDGEVSKSPPKHVRFSLDSTHPSPDLEAEYGGRSNRRRLIDFARRRQLLSHQTHSNLPPHRTRDGTDSLYHFLFHIIYSLLFVVKWCWRRISQLVHFVFRIEFTILVCACFIMWFVTGCVLLFCSSALRLPMGQFWLPLNDSEARIFESIEMLDTSERVCVWIYRWLADYLPRVAIT